MDEGGRQDRRAAQQEPRSASAASPDAVFLEQLGQRVRQARQRLRMSRKDLARASGVSERYLAQLETGRGNISVLLLRAIADATELRLEDLVQEDALDEELFDLLAAVRHAAPDERQRIATLLAQADSGDQAARRGERFALIGLRGAGKSTLGRLASERLGLPFVELNREIEAESGLSIPEIFSLYGDQGYRRLERRALKSVANRHRRVMLAVAGGIVGDEDTFAALLASFHTIWLRAQPEEHMERVRAQGDQRPMRNNPRAMDDLRAILTARARAYARAEISLDTSGQRLEDSLEALCRLVTDRMAAG